MAPGLHYRLRAIKLKVSPPSEGLELPTVHELDGNSNMILPQTPNQTRTLPPPEILVTPASDTSSDINFGTFSATASESEANATFTIADRFQSRRAENRFVQDLTQKIVSGMRQASDPLYKTPKVTAGTKRASPEDADIDELAKRVVLGVKEEVAGLIKRKSSTKFKKRSGETVVDDLATRIVRGMRKASEEDPKFMKDLVNLRQLKKTEVVTDSSADSPQVMKTKKSVGLGYSPTVPFYPTANTKAESDGGVALEYINDKNGRETGGDTDIAQTPTTKMKKPTGLRNRIIRSDMETDTDSNRPDTTDFVARRMISQALGVKVEQKKDDKTVAFRAALRMNKKMDRMSSWAEFLSKNDMKIYELEG